MTAETTQTQPGITAQCATAGGTFSRRITSYDCRQTKEQELRVREHGLPLCTSYAMRRPNSRNRLLAHRAHCHAQRRVQLSPICSVSPAPPARFYG
jgi:hypothetical protein